MALARTARGVDLTVTARDGARRDIMLTKKVVRMKRKKEGPEEGGRRGQGPGGTKKKRGTKSLSEGIRI